MIELFCFCLGVAIPWFSHQHRLRLGISSFWTNKDGTSMDTKHIRSGGTGITQRWHRGQLGVKMGGKPQSCHQSSDTPMISPFFRDDCCFNLTINHEMGDELPKFPHYVASPFRDAFSMINARWGPLVTNWFINPPNSGYNPHKPFVNLVTNQLS